MRLIDVDLLEKQMDKESIHLFNSMHKGYVKAMKCVKNQTTAFDTDKVMKQLEDHLFEKYCIEDDPEIAKIVEGVEGMRLIDADKVVEQLQEMKEEDVCKNISCVLCKYTAECMEGEMGEKVAIDKAIEIVEGASKNDE